MSVAVSPFANCPAIYSFAEGVSKESDKIRGLYASISLESRKPISFAWRDAPISQLMEIVEDCAKQGWDGYDAEPISYEIAVLTKYLIEILPDGIQVPSVIPESDGEISLEWRTPEQKHFVLTVTGPTLIYAGIFGGISKSYGEERFFRELSPRIKELLTSYFLEA